MTSMRVLLEGTKFMNKQLLIEVVSFGLVLVMIIVLGFIGFLLQSLRLLNFR